MTVHVDLSDLPASKEYLTRFTDTVFTPLFNGLSNAVMMVPKAGTNSFIKYAFSFPQKIGIGFADKIAAFLPIYIELEKAGTIDEIYQNILIQLGFQIDDDLSLHENIKTAIEKQVKTGKFICFICNHSESLFNNNLNIFDKLLTLYSINNGVIRFLLLFSREINPIELLSHLSPLGIQTINYIPLREEEDMDVLICKEEKWFGYKLKQSVSEKIVDKSGGYSALARGMLLLANESSDEFIKLSDEQLIYKPNIRMWLWKVYAALSEESKLQLMQSLIDDSKFIFSDYLIRTNIIKAGNKKFHYFSNLFKLLLIEISNDVEKITQKNGTIFIHDIKVDNLLSPQEYLVFKLLWDSRGKIVNRHEIAETMWGANSGNRYSDWSIDKAISRIRFKIGDNKKSKFIETKLGKGFIMNL